VLFGSKKGRRGAGASRSSDSSGSDVEKQQSRHWLAWRASAQKVTRAWNEWSAASGRDRARLYHRYITALAEEQQAAAELGRTRGDSC
jgi:hypothetical protein